MALHDVALAAAIPRSVLLVALVVLSGFFALWGSFYEVALLSPKELFADTAAILTATSASAAVKSSLPSKGEDSISHAVVSNAAASASNSLVTPSPSTSSRERGSVSNTASTSVAASSSRTSFGTPSRIISLSEGRSASLLLSGTRSSSTMALPSIVTTPTPTPAATLSSSPLFTVSDTPSGSPKATVAATLSGSLKATESAVFSLSSSASLSHSTSSSSVLPSHSSAGSSSTLPSHSSASSSSSLPSHSSASSSSTSPSISGAITSSRSTAASPSLTQRVQLPTASDSGRQRSYLLLLSSIEGMSGWLVALREAMTLSHRLGRIFVLPCVRAGTLIPCAPGKVIPVPDGSTGSVNSASADPLALPAFREDCDSRSKSLPLAEGRSYPLHAYFSLGAIADIAAQAGGARFIEFDEWARERVSMPASTSLRRRSRLLRQGSATGSLRNAPMSHRTAPAGHYEEPGSIDRNTTEATAAAAAADSLLDFNLRAILDRRRPPHVPPLADDRPQYMPLLVDEELLHVDDRSRLSHADAGGLTDYSDGGLTDHSGSRRRLLKQQQLLQSPPPSAPASALAPQSRLTLRPDGTISVPIPLLTPWYHGCDNPARERFHHYEFPSLQCMPGDSNDRKTTGLKTTSGHNLLQSSPFAEARDLFFAHWYRSDTYSAAIPGFPLFNPLHYPPVHVWLANIAATAPTTTIEQPAQQQQQRRPRFAVVQWRSETVSDELFPGCAVAMQDRLRAISSALGNMPVVPQQHKQQDTAAALPRGYPLVLVSDLPAVGSASEPPCKLSMYYSSSATNSNRTLALSAMLSIPGVFAYGTNALSSDAIVRNGGGHTMDAGVLAIRDYVIAVEADWMETCLLRYSPVTLSQRCTQCYWWSEFIYRAYVNRTELKKTTVADVFTSDMSRVRSAFSSK